MKNIVSFSLSEIEKKNSKGEVRATSKSAKSVNLPDGFWETAEVVSRESKKSVHLRLDPEVWEFFRAGGKGHLTRMNDVLRSYVIAQSEDSTNR